MTTVPTERSSMPTQRPSGGESNSGLSSAHSSKNITPSHGQRMETKVEQHAKQATAGRVEPATAGSSDSKQSESMFTSAKPNMEQPKPRQIEAEREQPQRLVQREEKKPGLDAALPGPASVPKDVVEEEIISLPPKPALSQFKTWSRDWAARDISTPARLHGKDNSEMKPVKNNYADNTKPQALSDYLPWQGNHSEDRISETTIKVGYHVKPQVLNESNTARPTLGPHLKSNTGLQNLSDFFATILQKRHDSGKLEAPSTFKPPPRVTLTDTKREVWLGELANPSVPLRKLSRTIPHGIRGKVLIEQCMIKNVPMTRAIWLAKCVGANELRAFRRKGISGAVMLENEHKWIRDWTILLESFIEEIGKVSGAPEWKPKLLYALRLTSRIISEGLLERDHFVDWALTRIERATYDALPLALLILQMIQPVIIQSVKYGRRMAATMLSKFHELSVSQDKHIYGPVINRLEHLITNVAFENPECFVVKQVWQSCRSSFFSLVLQLEQRSESGADEVTKSLQLLKAENLRRVMEHNDLIFRAISKTPSSDAAGELLLVQTLDDFKPQTSIDQIAAQCLLAEPDLGELIRILVNWASSSYRDGQYRIFIVTQLIRLWSKDGDDIDQHVLDSIRQLRDKKGVDCLKLSRLIAELIRFDCFDTVRFLRSLISSGGLYDMGRRYESQILVDMPLSHLPPRVLGLRDMLLRGARSDQRNSSPEIVAKLRDRIQQYLTLSEDAHDYRWDSQLDITNLRWSDVFEISSVVRRFLSTILSEIENLDGASEESIKDLARHSSQLKRVVVVLQAIGDMYTLADALSSILATADSHILFVAVQTIEADFENFAAAGAVESLFHAAVQRYHALKPTLVTPRTLLAIMCNVSKRLPSPKPVYRYFERELASCNASIGIAANTPMSDIQSEVPGDTDSELERILAGGVVMDFHRLSQAFELVISRMAKETGIDQNNLSLFDILGAIKSQNETTFQTVLKAWVTAELLKEENVEFGKLVSFLLVTGCIDETTLATITDAACEQIACEDPLAGASASLKALGFLQQPHYQADRSDLFDPRHDLAGATRMWEVNPDSMMRLLIRALAATSNPASIIAADNLCQSLSLLGPLRRLVVDKPSLLDSAIRSRSGSFPPALKERIYRIVWGLIDSSEEPSLVNLTAVEQLRLVFEEVGPLSLHFSQLCLQCLSTKSSESSEHDFSLSTVCVDVLMACRAGGSQLLTRLVSSLDFKIAQQVRATAEGRILIEASSIEEVLDALQSSEQADARFWGSIVEATSFSIPDQGDAEAGRLIEKHIVQAASMMTSVVEVQDELFQNWLQALCHLALIHGKSCSAPTSKAKIAQAFCGLLGRDVGQLTNPSVVAIFDAAAFYVEDLTPQAFALMRGTLGPLKSDRRIRFLFGIQENPDGWVHVLRASTDTPQATGAEAATSAPFPLRRWELLPEPAANVGANDTALSLRMFEARKIQ